MARKKAAKSVGWERTSPPRPEDIAKAATFPRAPVRRYTYTPQPFVGNPFDASAIADHSDAVRSAEHLRPLGLPPVEQEPTKPGFRILCAMPELETPHAALEKMDDQIIALEDHVEETTEDQIRAAEQLAALKRRRDICADINLLQLRLMNLAETSGFTVDVIDANQCAVEGVYEMRFADRFVDPSTYDVVFIDANDRDALGLARCGAKRVVLVGDQKNQPHAVTPTLTALYRVIVEELGLRRAQIKMPWAAPDVTLPPVSEDEAAVDAAIAAISA